MTMTLNEAILESGLVFGGYGLLTKTRIAAVPTEIWEIITPHTRLVTGNQSRSESPVVAKLDDDVLARYEAWLKE